MTSQLVIYRGLPGSGKTTDAIQLQKKTDGVLAGRDHLRFALFGSYDVGLQDEKLITGVQDSIIRAGLKNDRVVLVDDMNLKHSYVRRLIDVAIELRAEFTILDMTNIPVELCLTRNSLRSRKVPESVIMDLYTRYVKNNKYPLPVRFPERDLMSSDMYEPNTDKPLAIMCDIDGTLAHITDRDPYDAKNAWKDEVDVAVRSVLWAAEDSGIEVLFCSGRSDSHREVTIDWIVRNLDVPWEWVEERVFMRANGDMRKDSIVKLELFDRFIRHNYNVLYVLDDRQQVVDAWRSIGLKVFQVAEGNF